MLQKKHTVTAGENLSSIAKKHGLPGWQSLYFASENAAFRNSNPDPDKIYPGQVLVIPADKTKVRQIVQARLARLRQQKLASQQLFTEQRDGLSKDLNAIRNTSDQVDTAATVATLMVGLANSTAKAAKIMQLEGEIGSKAAIEFGKDALKDRAKNVRDLAANAVKDAQSASSNTAWLVVKSVAQAWCDITSPSFWANTFVNLWYEDMSWSEAVTTKPIDVYKDSLNRLMSTQNEVMKDLDKKIREAEQELLDLNKPSFI